MTSLSLILLLVLPVVMIGAHAELSRKFKLYVQTGWACTCSHHTCSWCYDTGGTDGKVKIKVFGDKGESQRITLDNAGNDREENQLDEYEFTVKKDIGMVTGLAFEHWKIYWMLSGNWMLSNATLHHVETGKDGKERLGPAIFFKFDRFLGEGELIKRDVPKCVGLVTGWTACSATCGKGTRTVKLTWYAKPPNKDCGSETAKEPCTEHEKCNEFQTT